MPGRDRCVGRKHAPLAQATGGFSKTHTLAFDQLPREFEREKSRVPFVEMTDAGIDSEPLQQTCAADSQHHLLDQTSFAIAAVKVSCHQAIGRFILSHVGIQEVKPDAADIGAPHPRAHRSATHHNFYQQRLFVFVVDAVQR